MSTEPRRERENIIKVCHYFVYSSIVRRVHCVYIWLTYLFFGSAVAVLLLSFRAMWEPLFGIVVVHEYEKLWKVSTRIKRMYEFEAKSLEYIFTLYRERLRSFCSEIIIVRFVITVQTSLSQRTVTVSGCVAKRKSESKIIRQYCLCSCCCCFCAGFSNFVCNRISSKYVCKFVQRTEQRTSTNDKQKNTCETQTRFSSLFINLYLFFFSVDHLLLLLF